jgi:outer membrane protein assembly factor BamB
MPNRVQRFCNLVCCWALTGLSASAQSGQWTTYGHDPQRSGWANDEAAFSPDNVSAMGLVWKTTVPNEPLAMNGLTAPLVVRAIHTQGGERNLAIVAGSSDHVFALDAETGKLVWQTDVVGEEKPPGASTWLCPFALNATPVIDVRNSRLFVVSSDGRLHSVALADGHLLAPPTTFVPPFSKMWSLNYSDGVLYTSLSQDCNNAHSGIVALVRTGSAWTTRDDVLQWRRVRAILLRRGHLGPWWTLGGFCRVRLRCNR